MGSTPVVVRPLEARDIEQCIEVRVAVVDEEIWLGTEPPLDVDRCRSQLEENLVLDDRRCLVAVVADSTGGAGTAADEQVVGWLTIYRETIGVADIGMQIVDGWRGRGVGRLLIEAAVEWAREVGVHKVCLQVWPHNTAARALYRRTGFVEEGVLRRHYRRRDGSLWDAVAMGLVLDEDSPGGPGGPPDGVSG
jgi:RimJ/RimL family protein N-acetyltransferase